MTVQKYRNKKKDTIKSCFVFSKITKMEMGRAYSMTGALLMGIYQYKMRSREQK